MNQQEEMGQCVQTYSGRVQDLTDILARTGYGDALTAPISFDRLREAEMCLPINRDNIDGISSTETTIHALRRSSLV
jgi:hypothetical protein